MNKKELSNYCLDSLKEAGMEKAEFYLGSSKRYEMNVFGPEITLLRTTFDNDLNLIAINGGKKGLISLNKTDEASLKEAVLNIVEMSNNAEQDSSNDISPMQPTLEISTGDTEPDLESMHQRLESFLKTVKEKYPKINIMDSFLDFTHTSSYYTNTNGVELRSQKGCYSFATTFAAQDGEKSSSFNYTGFITNKLDKELFEYGTVDLLFKQSTEQLDTKPIEGKFIGDVVITPDCLGDLLEAYFGIFLRNMALISGTSILKDKLNEKVASEKLTIHSNPISDELAGGYYITPDGFRAQNMTIIKDGVLKNFLLNLYGANKTGKERAVNPGGAYIIEPGDKSFDEIVKSMKRGIIVSRFSGGNPSNSGDFSGIAKNSYYVENGVIKYPVSETMIAGNLYEMFNNIIEISRERVNFGNSILPWIAASGITVSGK